MPCVSFHTLGCKLNYAETNTLQQQFEDRAFDVVPFGDQADVTVVNTCTVTSEAERKCRQVIRRALRANPDAFVVVTGCYAQLRADDITAIPGVDAVLGADEKFRLFELLDSFDKAERTQVHVSCIDEAPTFGPAVSTSDRTRAFLKIQDGCDYGCAFCTIPMARGPSRSATIDETVAQARRVAEQGFREVVLTGVNIGLFGQEHGATLLDLVTALDRVDGIARYRISSIEPNLLTDALIDLVASSDRFQPHFHIPLQSGDDEVLGHMRRRYRTSVYAGRVARIVSLLPDACVGADVIVGFPSETKQHFDNTVAFLNDLPLAYLHAFTYSERPGTVAVDQLDKIAEAPVPGPERSRRNRVLRLLSGRKRRAFYASYLGDVRPVLWEQAEKDGAMFGFTDNYIRVRRPSDPTRTGRIEDVRLESIASDGTVQAGDPAFVSLV